MSRKAKTNAQTNDRWEVGALKADALEALYIAYYNDVLLYALSISRNRAVAEDLAAEAFYKALISADEHIKDFKPWLMAVCRNVYMTWLRKQSRYTELYDDLPDGEESTLDKIIRDEEYRALYRAVSLLPREQNEVILLFYFEDLPVRSIAVITGKSETYVKVLLYRARENLRKLLEV